MKDAPTIPGPAEWCEALGERTGYRVVDSDGLVWEHPIAPMDVLMPILLRHEDDGEALAALAATGEDLPSDHWVAPALIAYARRGLYAGFRVSRSLSRAFAAHLRQDFAAAAKLLDDATDAETDYGDDIDTEELADALGYRKDGTTRAWAVDRDRQIRDALEDTIDVREGSLPDTWVAQVEDNGGVEGDDPDADDMLDEIRAALVGIATADWTGDGGDDGIDGTSYSDVLIEWAPTERDDHPTTGRVDAYGRDLATVERMRTVARESSDVQLEDTVTRLEQRAQSEGLYGEDEILLEMARNEMRARGLPA